MLSADVIAYLENKMKKNINNYAIQIDYEYYNMGLSNESQNSREFVFRFI